MMSPDQVKTVSDVFRKFMESETQNTWDSLDDQMSHLEYLSDDEIHREADIQVYYHSKGTVKCGHEFCNQGCYAQTIVDAVGYILELYKDGGEMHKNNRYVLEYYLSLSALRMIVSDPK